MLAAIPHLVGIVCGHVYHFFTVVHPLMGAKRRIGAPAWMKRRLDGGDNPNFMDAPGERIITTISPVTVLRGSYGTLVALTRSFPKSLNCGHESMCDK